MKEKEVLVAKVEMFMVDDFKIRFGTSVLEILPNLEKAVLSMIDKENINLFKAFCMDCENIPQIESGETK